MQKEKEELIITEINSEEELKEFAKSLEKGEFLPNCVNYKGNIGYVIGNKLHLAVGNKSKYTEDFFHKNHFNLATGTNAIWKVFKVTLADKSFNAKDPHSWVTITVDRLVDKEGYYAETRDYNKYSELGKNILHKGGELANIFNTEEELLELGFVKGEINANYWFHRSEVKYMDIMLPYKKFDNTIFKVNIQNLEKELRFEGCDQEEVSTTVSKNIKQNIKFGVDSITYAAFEGIRYSFGVEIETCLGRLEKEDYMNLNLKAVHDGSLRDKEGNTPGGEYVSGVLVGDAGLTQLNDICRVLSHKCKVNHQCGVHIHAGNLEWSKEDIVYSYLLAEQLEDELFSMLPKSRRSNSYCRRLTQLTLKYLPDLRNSINSKGEYNIIIDEIYDIIHKEVTIVKGKEKVKLAMANSSDSFLASKIYNKKQQHPNGAKCQYDKNAQRYCWLNYVTLLYNTKGGNNSRTLEIRNHSATMNYIKIRNWIKVFFAFCKYVETNKINILTGKTTLEKVVRTVYPKTGERLIQYIEERKQVFNINDESIDYVEASVSSKRKTIKEVVETI